MAKVLILPEALLKQTAAKVVSPAKHHPPNGCAKLLIRNVRLACGFGKPSCFKESLGFLSVARHNN
jgi:hypothetical protein